MTSLPLSIEPVPAATIRVARAAFPKGALALRLRDALGSPNAAPATAGQFVADHPRDAPWRLALITVLQFVERLTDHQAATAVGNRIDWKYGLSLHLTDPGLDPDALRQFRARCVAGTAEHALLDALLLRFETQGLLKTRGRQRRDATQVVATVEAFNRAARQV